MKPPQQKAVRFMLPLMLLFGFVVMTWPASIALDIEPAGQSLGAPEGAKNIPVSTIFIRLKITVEDKTVYASHFDGGLIKIEKEQAFIYGFSPYITDKDSSEVSIRVYQIGRIKGQDGSIVGESIKELETLKAGAATDNRLIAYKDANANFTIEIIDVKKDYEIKDPVIARELYSGTQCCITCNGLTTCACAVSTNCGDCCRRACCPILGD